MGYSTLETMDLRQKRILLRLDLNVPIKDGQIEDDTRLKATLPTLSYILKKTHKLCIISHLGDPKGRNMELSLRPVGQYLAEALQREVLLVDDYKEPVDQLLPQLGFNQLLLLENLRFYPEEMENDTHFAIELSKGFDVFINDAFGSLHRHHASIIGIPSQFPRSKKGIGFLVAKEINQLNRLLKSPQAPFGVIVGGKKVRDKLGMLLHMVTMCHHLCLAGAMAYPFLAQEGVEIEGRLEEPGEKEMVRTVRELAKRHGVQIHLPLDHMLCAKKNEGEGEEEEEPVLWSKPNIPENFIGLDIGPQTWRAYGKIIRSCKTIFWNGPAGAFERPAFAQGTWELAKAVTEVSGFSLVGGGDSAAALVRSGMADRVSHISTGGGAALAYLEGRSLPGLSALESV